MALFGSSWLEESGDLDGFGHLSHWLEDEEFSSENNEQYKEVSCFLDRDDNLSCGKTKSRKYKDYNKIS